MFEIIMYVGLCGLFVSISMILIDAYVGCKYYEYIEVFHDVTLYEIGFVLFSFSILLAIAGAFFTSELGVIILNALK